MMMQTIATNLRAWNFQIKETDRAEVKVTAGKIMPALATTTAMVCGLMDIEFCKLVLGLQVRDAPHSVAAGLRHQIERSTCRALPAYYNSCCLLGAHQNLGAEKFLASNINLALGVEAFNCFNPDPPIQVQTNYPPMPFFTVWDTLVFDEGDGVSAASGDLSGGALAASIERRFPGVAVEELRVVGGSAVGANKRFKKELEALAADPVAGVAVNVGGDASGNPNIAHARISGPKGTPYEGAEFLVEYEASEDYPNKEVRGAIATGL